MLAFTFGISLLTGLIRVVAGWTAARAGVSEGLKEEAAVPPPVRRGNGCAAYLS